MSEKQEGSMLVNVAIAIFAGALSSVLILVFTHGFSISGALLEPGRALRGDHVELTDVASSSTELALTEEVAMDPALPGTDLDAEMMKLQATLKTAADEQAKLTATIVALTSRMTKLESEMINLESRQTIGTDITDGSAELEAIHRAGRAEGNPALLGEAPAERQFESLLAAGLDEESARDLQLRGDQYQLARLELFDQASREGWVDSDQFDEQLDALEESQPDLRTELGDGAYDRYLYESGRTNRVEIASVINGSAADQAGLQAGDVVSSYAEERVYTVQDLQSATRTGTRGEYVQLLVERDGEIQRTDIPRGPLGVTLQSIRQQP